MKNSENIKFYTVSQERHLDLNKLMKEFFCETKRIKKTNKKSNKK